MANFNDVSNKAKDVKDNAQELGDSIKDNATEIGRKLKDKATEAGQEAYSKFSMTKNVVAEWVSDNPYKSLGIAFVAGMLLTKCRIEKD